MIGDKWERTNDIAGHRPLFRVYCRFCDEDMVQRYSAVFAAPNLLHGFAEAGNQMAFKCQKCGSHIKFNIVDDREYMEKIQAIRGSGQHHPISEWEENEQIKKQLEALGYWGGREEV